MKAVIMCAGKGTRMRPLTESVQKVLLPVNGRPFLSYLIANLRAAGVTEFCFVVGYLKEQVIEYITSLGLSAAFISQNNPRGTGEAIGLCCDFVDGEDFLAINGDNYWSVDDFRNILSESGFNYVMGIKVDAPSKYGVLVVEDGFLKKLVEKPEVFVSDLINTGLYKFTSEVFDKIETLVPSKRGELELTDALQMLADEGKVKVLISSSWMDLGKIEDIEKMEDKLSK